jgi:spermidine/putrescine transport system permease protein
VTVRRWFWPSFAFPGVAWLILLFLVPTYAVIAVAFGTLDPLSLNPVPAWNPLDWQFSTMQAVLTELKPGGTFWIVFVRTFEYVAISLAGCLLIGYPVAYYLARFARRTRGILLVLLVVPFWVSYLMRMLAWVGLLLPDGLVNRVLIDLGILSHPHDWLGGQPSSVIFALIYGYVPYMILPLYAVLDRIDKSVLEAGRDLGGNPISTFIHVTLPLSKNGILAASVLITLPMFGDYYTNDVISNSPRTSMIGNQINLFFQEGTEKAVGASLVLVLSLFLAILMSYYLWITVRASAETKESLL